jgi:hypothetical protein
VNGVQVSDKDKLEKIGKMIARWSNQPDPGPGEDESIEAADVLYEIEAVLEEVS